MSQDFDNKISQLNSRVSHQKAEMEAVRIRFVDAVIPFMQDWYLKKAEAEVKGKPDKTAEHGPVNLGRLKSEVKKIVDNAPSYIPKELADPQLWWHLRQGNQSYSYLGHRPPDGIEKAIRLIAGRLAMPLERFEYLDADYRNPNAWKEWDVTGDRHSFNARPSYNSYLEWSDEMKRIINEYASLHEKSRVHASEMETLMRAKKESEAKSLWDSV